jgi:hypothetical protein
MDAGIRAKQTTQGVDMKRSFVLGLALIFVLSGFALVFAQGAPAPTPPAAGTTPPPPPPPPPPPAPEKTIKAILNVAQMGTAKSAATGAEVTLTKHQLKTVLKSWPEFKGKTAKIMPDHVYGKKKVMLTMKDGALVSAPPPPPPPKKGK